MTNYDRIRNMSISEMAKLLGNDDVLIAPCNARDCPHYNESDVCRVSKEEECMKATINWLKGEELK